VKVIYSFRLKKGDPANAARLAQYITKNYADTLDCFLDRQRARLFIKTYEPFRDAWKPIYRGDPQGRPGREVRRPRDLAQELRAGVRRTSFIPAGHLAMVSTHTYAMGNGRLAEKTRPPARDRFVSNKTLAGYQRLYDGIVKAAGGEEHRLPLGRDQQLLGRRARRTALTPTRVRSGCSDYLNWWANHRIEGMNFHTGDTVNGFPIMTANYAVFVHGPTAGSSTCARSPTASSRSHRLPPESP
jgi:hypothetical protein